MCCLLNFNSLSSAVAPLYKSLGQLVLSELDTLADSYLVYLSCNNLLFPQFVYSSGQELVRLLNLNCLHSLTALHKVCCLVTKDRQLTLCSKSLLLLANACAAKEIFSKLSKKYYRKLAVGGRTSSRIDSNCPRPVSPPSRCNRHKLSLRVWSAFSLRFFVEFWCRFQRSYVVEHAFAY